mmetsp:Transcript_2823/g.5028  ORF Transcript_2823/g.5028 Transcript_2823/m.5028 type:complete len:361 (+) Transcript_2823:79-1161(+)
MELLQPLHHFLHLLHGGQDGGTEVEGAGRLAKARAGHGGDAGGLEQLEAVKDVHGLTRSRGGRHSALRKTDLREGVHGALREVARHALQGVEAVCHDVCALAEGVQDQLLLSLELIVRGHSWLRRVNHQTHRYLTGHVGGEVDGGDLVDLVDAPLVDVDHLDVATTQAALTQGALGHGVEAHHLETTAVRLAHVVSSATRADEGPLILIDVLLVHLVTEQDNLLVVRELHQLAQVVLAQALSRRVSGVDEHHRADVLARAARRFHRARHRRDVHRPAIVLIEGVRNQRAAVELDGGGVERVLWDRHHDAVVLITDERREAHSDRHAGSVGQENVVWVGRGHAVALCNVIGHLLPDAQRAS